MVGNRLRGVMSLIVHLATITPCAEQRASQSTAKPTGPGQHRNAPQDVPVPARRP